MSKHEYNSRREFLKKTAYVVPVILTLQATPALATIGSPRIKTGKGQNAQGGKSSDKGFRGLLKLVFGGFKF